MKLGVALVFMTHLHLHLYLKSFKVTRSTWPPYWITQVCPLPRQQPITAGCVLWRGATMSPQVTRELSSFTSPITSLPFPPTYYFYFFFIIFLLFFGSTFSSSVVSFLIYYLFCNKFTCGTLIICCRVRIVCKAEL